MKQDQQKIPATVFVTGAVIAIAIAVGVIVKAMSPSDGVPANVAGVTQPATSPSEVPATTTTTGKPIPQRNGNE